MTVSSVLLNRTVLVTVITACAGLGLGASGASDRTSGPAAALQQAPAASEPAGRRPSQSPSGSTGGGWEWWNDARVQKEIGLSADKARIINDIYAKRNESLKALREEFVREFNELDQITRARTVDEGTYAVKVTRVESLRSELSKSRTVMLYRLFRELTPEQYRKLQDIFDRDRRNQDRGRGAPPATK